MKIMAHKDFDPAAAAHELLDGSGAVLLPGLFDKDMINKAREILVKETDTTIETGSHFNQSGTDASLQRRVWFPRLAELSPIFVEMLENQQIFDIMQHFLGSEFVLGSLCASRLMPGFGGQEPHIDYPYWDLYRKQTFPMKINASFPLNAQAIILIDPFTEENGATALVPGTQKSLRYPTKEDNFFDQCIRLTGQPGDVILFFGATWHCGMPNRSQAGRIGMLVEYLPKFVKPIEDMLHGLDPKFQQGLSARMQQLLGFDYPWPSAPPNPPIAANQPVAN